jgi:hypothetical protein
MTHYERLKANDQPEHDPSPVWNVAEPETETEPGYADWDGTATMRPTPRSATWTRPGPGSAP